VTSELSYLTVCNHTARRTASQVTPRHRAYPGASLSVASSNSLENAHAAYVKRLNRLSRTPGSLQRGPRFSQVVPFLHELSPRESWNGKDRVAKFAALRRDCSLPIGASAQPLDRQLRYYSEGPRLASRAL